jgi:hypothetical protein
MNQAYRGIQSKAISYPTGRFAWALLLAVLALTACAAPTDLSAQDEAAIYAAVIRRIYVQDDTFGGTLQPDTLYVLQTTDDGKGDPETEQGAPALLPEALQNEIAQSLADLPTQIVWVADAGQVPQDAHGQVAGKGAIITLGNIHPQEDGSVYLSGSIYVAMLASGGQTYIVERVDGSWEVTGNTGIVWMS